MWNLAYAAMDEFGQEGMGVQAILEHIATQMYAIENETNNATGAAGALGGALGTAGYEAEKLSYQMTEVERKAKAAADAIAQMKAAQRESYETEYDSGSKYSEDYKTSVSPVINKGPLPNNDNTIVYGNSYKKTSTSSSKSIGATYKKSTTAFANTLKSAKKSHSGEPYVKKVNTPWDEALGLSSNETLRILKVGERVIPSEQNLHRGSTSLLDGNASAVTSSMSRAVNNISSKEGESINLSIGDIVIEGNADKETVEALKKERESLIQGVFDRIQKHNKTSGFRNMKYATV